MAAISMSDPFVKLTCPRNAWKLARGPLIRVAATGEPDADLLDVVSKATTFTVGTVRVELAGIDPDSVDGGRNVEVDETDHALRDDVEATVVQGSRGCVLSLDTESGRVYRLGFTDLDALHDHVTSLGYPRTFKASATLMLRSRSLSLEELFPAWVDPEVAEKVASSLLTDEAVERLLRGLTDGAEDVDETPTGRVLLSATQAAWLCEGVFPG